MPLVFVVSRCRPSGAKDTASTEKGNVHSRCLIPAAVSSSPYHPVPVVTPRFQGSFAGFESGSGNEARGPSLDIGTGAGGVGSGMGGVIGGGVGGT